VLRARAAAEIPLIRKVKEQLAERVALIPFQAEEPVGIKRLNSLAAAVAA
jgi:arsenite-transporting ATPase